jgi:DNA-binding NtrC family response regulator
MTLDLFRLDAIDNEDIDRWVEILDLRDFRSHGPADSEAAPWTGHPFIIAGHASDLDGWFKSRDKASARVLANCAYFWVLTDRKYHHDLLRGDRVVVLNWHTDDQHNVRSALAMLERFPRLAGLSHDMHHLREEIIRLSFGPKGPSTHVLILGETGTGKEEVAQSLVAESVVPKKPGLHCIGGASLNMESGLALTEMFGIDRGTASEVKERPGLVEVYSKGALLIDDFDTAPRVLQEQLLRLTSVKKGESAPYRRVGGSKDRLTKVWLLFATNLDIEKMLAGYQLRPDFLYRFEDRVISIPPLRDRPADLSAIARHLWSQILKESDAPSEARHQDRGVLPWKSLREMCSHELQFDGNVRELNAFLRLVVSMTRMPRNRKYSTEELIEKVLATGSTFKEWFVNILASGGYTDSPATPKEPTTREILRLDALPQSNQGLSGCEQIVQEMLGSRWSELCRLVERRAHAAQIKVRRNLCRYLVHASKFGTVCIADAEELGGVKNAQARKHLSWLAEESQFLDQPKSKSNAKLVYRLGRYFAEAATAPPTSP